jgi:hypothetical protein
VVALVLRISIVFAVGFPSLATYLSPLAPPPLSWLQRLSSLGAPGLNRLWGFAQRLPLPVFPFPALPKRADDRRIF